jgi:acyl phosphate:glycerol-3-phosphate acyltransferase
VNPGTAAVAIGLGYLVGAIPFGVIAGRMAGGIDLREHGSRRTGSTNALRTLGLRWAAAVLLLDIGKGLAATLLARALMSGVAGGEWIVAGAAVAAIVGHNWSIFIGLRGGRGVATAGGGLLGMAPLAVAILLPVMLAVVLRSRYVSMGSITGALLAPVVTAGLAAVGWASGASVGYGLAIALLVTGSHLDNIRRLRAGTERKIGHKETAPTDARA